MPEPFQIPLDELNDWVQKETASLVEPLRAEAKKTIEDNRTKLEELLDACDKLLDDAEKELAKGSRKTYRRAKFLQKLAGQFSDLIEKIVIPEEINGKTLDELSEQIGKAIKTIGDDKNKWFRALSPYFIMSRRRFEVSFKRAEDSYRSFTEFLAQDYSKAKSAENIFSKIDDLREALVEFNKYESGKEARKTKKELLTKKIETTEMKLERIQTKDELVELAQINDRIDELTNTVKHELRHIEKPLLKFQTLVNNPGYSLVPEANIKLEEYLNVPFEALATEKEGYPLLVSILLKIDSALDNKKMKLKSSRLRKAKDQIDRIVNKSGLVSLHKDCAETFAKKADLSKSGVISESRDERAMLQERLKDLQRRMSIIEARDERLKKEHEQLRKRVDDQKKSLETIASELSNKTVTLVLA
jgi:hypothetical protein